MKHIRLSELKEYFATRNESYLINEVVELFKRFDVVKDYYTSKLSVTDSKLVLDRYKSIITKEFFPERGFGKARLSIARKAVNDYKKVAVSNSGTIDIMLHYVENGSQFTNEYGDMDEAFYNSMEGMYEDALKLIVKNKLAAEFEIRCREIVRNAIEGWGFKDQLEYLYDEYINR
ncbi:MAG: DUF6155 family protein [bacterium]|nr:DUF6155 family protein [bacterium]